MIVITCATGNTGRPAAEALLAKGEKVRVIGRTASSLESFGQKGAEVFIGDVENAASMSDAFREADSVFLVIPQVLDREDYRDYQERVSDSYAAAVEKSGVRHVVALSGIGAQHSGKIGVATGLHNMEQKLNRTPGVNVLHLRPGYFMENLLMTADPIRTMGIFPGAFTHDAPLPWIAAQDIGRYAAARLQARDFSGSSTQELLGPRDITMREIASIIGKSIGLPRLGYTQVPYSMLEMALGQTGMPKSSAALLIELWKAAEAGLVVPQESRSAANTTPTSMEQFVANVFAPAYLAKKDHA
jgi:uncharacterized protein YbjT (DUF2867 family)